MFLLLVAKSVEVHKKAEIAIHLSHFLCDLANDPPSFIIYDIHLVDFLIPGGFCIPKWLIIARIYGVSRVPLRQAMAQLERDGIICKFQGKGAFVKNNPRQLVQELAFPTLDSSTKASVDSKVLTIEKVFASNSVICEQLQVTPDTLLLYIERLFYHDGRPSGINHVWFRESDVPGLTESSLLYNNISRTLKYTYHYDIIKIENYIEAVRLDATSASLLNTVYDATGLKIDSQYLLADGKAIEYSSTTWLGDFTRFHFNVTK